MSQHLCTPPLHVGVYQVQRQGDESWKCFSFWDGMVWGMFTNAPETAARYKGQPTGAVIKAWRAAPEVLIPADPVAKKKTPPGWYPGSQAPTGAGVYERNYDDHGGGIWFSNWNGTRWGNGHKTIEECSSTESAGYVDLPWRWPARTAKDALSAYKTALATGKKSPKLLLLEAG